MLRKNVLALLFIATSLFANAQPQVKEPTFGSAEWSQDYEPFRIAGNLYYIGSYDLGMYLITTPQGHILINTGLAASADMIQKHMEQLGFKATDIRIMLSNQMHFDHAGGMAAVQKLSGAKVMIMEGDEGVAQDGGKSDCTMGSILGVTFAPVHIDRILHNNDKIELGGVVLTALKHPGHTKGSCSYMLTVKDGAKKYKVLIANMPKMLPEVEPNGMESYPNVAKDFEYTYAVMPKLQFDLWVAAHASQFDLHKKHQPGDKYNPEAFRDRKGYLEKIEVLHKEYLDKKGTK
ncbi:MAG: subclass B3 metallo-beta-lactamase [Bacteroidetes bacterium]|nr:subclass B3 metallo-beta-lactamase [Bacteroidota bacterium]